MMDIAFNTQHTGFRGHDHKGYAVTMTKEQVDKVLALSVLITASSGTTIELRQTLSQRRLLT